MRFAYLALLVLPLSTAYADGNTTITSFNKAKKALEREVYHDHRETIYCAASFDAKKNIEPPAGFTTDKHVKRSKRVEWEHVVPAQNFGQTFVEWREGHSECVSSKGKSFKGRKCASKMNHSYRYMQADLYNLYPAIGAVNAMRSNYNFTMLPGVENMFGSCPMKIESRKAEPPEVARGRIARTYMYMEAVYPNYSMSRQQKQLMNAWSNQFPVNAWECKRAKRIASIQGNENLVVKSHCEAVKLW